MFPRTFGRVGRNFNPILCWFGCKLGPTMEEVMCPSCGEWFAVMVPGTDERPAMLDYDCEICCRPLVLVVDVDGTVDARGVGA